MKRAIVIGASSGIGREVAQRLKKEGWTLGVAARRVEELRTIGEVEVEQIDVTQEDATIRLRNLIERLGGMDLFFYASGIGNSTVPNYAMADTLVAAQDQKPFLFTDPYGNYGAPFLTMPTYSWTRNRGPQAFHFGIDGIIDYVKDTGISAQRIYASMGLRPTSPSTSSSTARRPSPSSTPSTRSR